MGRGVENEWARSQNTPIGPDEVPLCHYISHLGAFFKTVIIAAEFNTENMKVSSTLYDIGVFPSYTKLAALLFFYSS